MDPSTLDGNTASEENKDVDETSIINLDDLIKKCDQFDEVSEILPGLYLSSISVVSNPKLMSDHSIGAVLSLLSEESDFDCLDGVEYHLVEVDDQQNTDLLRHFSQTNSLIDQWRLEQGRNVLVHCVMGMSRSATIVVAYLMHHLSIGHEEALATVRAKRPVIRPNRGFRHQLAFFEHLNNSVRVNDTRYQRYLFLRLVQCMVAGLKPLELREESYEPNEETLHYIEQLAQGHEDIDLSKTTNYKCRTCRQVIFTEEQVLHKDAFNLNVNFLPWMAKDTNYFLIMGKIYCPNCKQKIGRYRWLEPCPNVIKFAFGESLKTSSQEAFELDLPMIFTISMSSVDVSTPLKINN